VTHPQLREAILDIDRAKVFPEPGKVAQIGTQSNLSGIVTGSPPGSEAQPGGSYSIIPIGWLGVTPWIAKASVTRQGPGGVPVVGQEIFETMSVQLDQAGQFIRVEFDLIANEPAPFTIMVIIGWT
jgi:hypothetical protein